MSGKKRGLQTPSTVEAIRMASASILGTTTGKGYPLGSAIGTGSKMEENSEDVALRITPLIFSLHDELLSSENLELLSIEWDLEGGHGQEVLPEHLIITGGKFGDVSSHICALSWEKGIIDPFKMDSYISGVAKKLSDIERAIIVNSLEYETDGIMILKRFSDRFNSVTFVEMLDRQFQETWESQKVKVENVDIETVLKYEYRDDFASNPPGPRIQRRKSAEFMMPDANENELVLHLQHRLLSPKGLEAIASRIPDMGRNILAELNEYAYSIEEVDIARAGIAALVSFLGKEEVTLSELSYLASQTGEFSEAMSDTVDALAEVLEQHATSGSRFTIDEHQQALLSLLENQSDYLNPLQIAFGKALLEHLAKSIRREFPTAEVIRAWELKATLSYFVAFARRVLGYISRELQQFLQLSSVHSIMRQTLQEFKDEAEGEISDPTELMLFHKFYSELYSLLNAIIDRKSYEGFERKPIEVLVDEITNEVSGAFKSIDVWELIGFGDLAEIARTEIQSRSDSESQAVSNETLLSLLSDYEKFVTETLPDVAETFLSKHFLTAVIDTMSETEDGLIAIIRRLIDAESEKPDEWRKEAELWLSQLGALIDESMPLSEKLFTLIKLAYMQLGEGVSPDSVIERIQEDTNDLETAYNEEVEKWVETCRQIDRENEPIRENNEKREAKLVEAVKSFEAEMKQYEEALESHKHLLAAHQLEADGSSPPPPSPEKPESLESRRARIDKEFPEMVEKQKPPKPEPSERLIIHAALRDLLKESFEKMKRSQERMEQVLTLRLRALRAEGAKMAEGLTIGISTGFLEFLMNSEIRKLGQLLPRVKRAYLRDTDDPSLVYLVTYEFRGNMLSVSIGNNLLRRQ